MELGFGGRMARINVEDDLFGDFRFENLVEKLGDLEKAIGKMVRIWKLAQKYWVDNKSLIPHEIFEKGPWQTVLEVGLAEKRETGYYVSGSEKQFAWIFQKSSAGKKSAEARMSKYGSNQPVKPRTALEQRSTPVERSPNTPEPLTLTLTPTPSLTHNNTRIQGEEYARTRATPEEEHLAFQVLKSYAEGFERTRGIKALISVKRKQQALNLVRILGKDAPAVAEFYTRHTKKYYLQRVHDFEVLLKDAETLHAQWQKGKMVI